MAHNIITHSDRRPGDGLPEGWGGPTLPADGDAVLVANGDRGAVTILFHRGLGLHPASVVLHPWNTDGQRAARISGEDLYAFRELLNELPEEAFVRPKDPVELPRWTDGDIVKPRGDSTVTYIRRDGEWDRTCMGVIRPGDSSDKLISDRVDNKGYLVVLQQEA